MCFVSRIKQKIGTQTYLKAPITSTYQSYFKKAKISSLVLSKNEKLEPGTGLKSSRSSSFCHDQVKLSSKVSVRHDRRKILSVT